MCVCIYIGGQESLTVDFGSSLSEAVLKFYPAVAEVSNVSPACLSYSADLSSSAVELLVAVSDMTEDGINGTVGEASRHHEVGVKRLSTAFLRGRQYLVFTARKIKASRIPDRVEILSLYQANRPCRNDATC